MSVITRDNALKRSVKRLTTATGATADFVPDVTQMNASRPINLAIFDARTEDPNRRFFSQLPKNARILYIVQGEDLVTRVRLFEDPRATSLFCHDERFDDDEFISSATKALRGEIFGLQKYFPWGVTTFTMLVKNYEEKGRAIDIMMRYAQLAAVRGPVRDRIQLVADELMMNALYHAPVDERGQERYNGMTLKQLAALPEVNAVQVQYGCSGRYFGIAVRDAGGSLRRERALEYLVRARGQAQMEQKTSGAGLGLVSVLHSVSKLVFNLAPGYSTEVIGLFDMELFAKGKVGARSLHLFTASASQTGETDIEEPEERDTIAQPQLQRPAPTAARGGTWILAAVLGAVAASLGTAYYFQRHARPAPHAEGEPPPAAAQVGPSLTVVPDPSDAQVRINGAVVAPGVALSVPSGSDLLEITVSRPGYREWTNTVHAAELSGPERMYVRLDKSR